MFGSEGLLLDRERALIEWLGPGVVALGLVQPGEAIERVGDARMLGPEGLLPDREGALVERLGRA